MTAGLPHGHNPRDTATDLHRTIDDRPFGGGPGMVMMAEPLAQTIDAVRASGNCGRVLSFAPNGARLTDARVREIAAAKEPIVLVCGRYEGIDAVVRQLPGAIKDLSASDESFATGLLDAPHYTRPEVWRGMPVPDVLLSGHHKNIGKWSREKSLALTLRTRPDLIRIADSSGLLTREDVKFLRTMGAKNISEGRRS